MPLTETTHKKALDFLEVINIANEIVINSKLVDEETKDAYKEHDIWNINTINDLITKKNLSSAALKSLIDSYFIFWNESAGTDIEEFWDRLQKNSLDFVRKDPLQFALKKDRFRNVHQAMSVRKNWERLKDSLLLKNRLSEMNIQKIDQIVQRDEFKRVKLLKKCLAKKRIPQSQYLKFGDSMGYLAHCQLFEKYFNKTEYYELHKVWQNFESK